jgi:hypothetical protein|tara:strand:+ start:1368 stop:1691 length:324 start_codon:yes stop_codon:yes gene_type:complete
MVKKLIRNIPLSDAYRSQPFGRDTYTKEEVNALIAAAVAEARAIDEASMAKHNRDATVISMILGFTVLALFIDGLLRILGIIPPFMDIDVNIIDDITRQVLEKLPKL